MGLGSISACKKSEYDDTYDITSILTFIIVIIFIIISIIMIIHLASLDTLTWAADCLGAHWRA